MNTGRSLVFITSLLATFSLLMAVPQNGVAFECVSKSKALSNALPPDLVRELQNVRLWNFDYYDSPRTSQEANEVESIKEFWHLLVSNQNYNVVKANLFGEIEVESSSRFFPRTYAAKVGILRAAYETPAKVSGCIGKSQINRIYNSWMSHYIEMLEDMITLTGIDEYKPILKLFKKKRSQKKLEVIDLSPSYRKQLQTLHSGQHQVSLLEFDEKYQIYKTTGVYIGSQKLMAIDFARDISDTFVTFAHEVVHAADPVQIDYQARLGKAHSDTIKIVSNWLGDETQARLWAQRLLNQVLHETDLASAHEAIQKLTEIRIEQLKKRNGEINDQGLDFQPSAGDLQKVKEFIDIAIGLSLENEFRAYSLSIMAYVNLKDTKGLLAPIQWRESQVDSILRGDKVFAAGLYAQLGTNPFGYIRTEYNANVAELKSRGKLSKEAEELLLKLEKSLNLVEQIYLESIKEFLNKQRSKYSSNVQVYQKLDHDTRSQLPYYAQPGGIDSPDNPYIAILSSRLTTAWVLRFRSNIDEIVGDLSFHNEYLLALHAGILDLHELSDTEQYLMGIKYVGARYDPTNYTRGQNGNFVWSPKNVRIPKDMQDYFTLIRWVPQAAYIGGSAQQAHRGPLAGPELMTNLIRLKMFKLVKWAKLIFPVYHTTIVKNLSFLHKLQEGQYNREEISDTRAKTLIEELDGVISQASISRDQLSKMNILLTSLSLVHRVASNYRWQQMTNFTLGQIETLNSAMEVLRVFRNMSNEDIKVEIDQDLAMLSESLAPTLENCKGKSGNPYDIGALTTPTVQLGAHSFTVVAACMNGQLYLLRRPGDRVNDLPTTLSTITPQGPRPTAYIDIGVRPIVLIPYQPVKKLR